MRNFDLGSDWINTDEELPPCDGLYEVANFKLKLTAFMNYDGIGFSHDGFYVPVQFWRKPQPILKKYGKVE